MASSRINRAGSLTSVRAKAINCLSPWLRLLTLDKTIVMIPLLGAVAPSGSNINQVAILYNKDAQYASAINVLTTLTCIATIPLWIMLYEALVG